MWNHTSNRGFTLIELLTVILIIAVLAAILFPVYAKTREKSWQSSCTSNQRQFVMAIHMWAQDHSFKFPDAKTVWNDLHFERKLLICPTKGDKLPNGYGYSYGLSNKSLADKNLNTPEKLMVTADAIPSAGNIIMDNSDIDMRHTSKTLMSFSDGHVELTDRIPKFLVLDNTQDLWDGFPSPSLYGYATDGVSNGGGDLPPGWTLSPGTFADQDWGWGNGMWSWGYPYLYMGANSAGWGGPAKNKNYVATRELDGKTKSCQLWTLNIGKMANYENGLTTTPGHAACDGTIDVVDPANKVIASLRFLCVDNANPALTKSSLLFDGIDLLPPQTGVVDAGDIVWGYGYNTKLGYYSLSFTGGMYGTTPKVSCNITSFTTATFTGTVTTNMVDQTADVKHPAYLVFHMNDSGGTGNTAYKISTNDPFNFQYSESN